MTTSYVLANDPYVAGWPADIDALGNNSAAVTPSDTVDFASYPKAILVVAAGSLVVLPLKAPDDGAHLITIAHVEPQFIVPFRVRRVMATGTSASVVAVTD
jgi:hypothetical protein